MRQCKITSVLIDSTQKSPLVQVPGKNPKKGLSTKRKSVWVGNTVEGEGGVLLST